MLQVTQINATATFVQNTDVKNCEAIVFAEAVRTGKTMLQIINYVLEEDDSDTNLLCACETLQEEIVKQYKKQILEQYLDNALYDVQQGN
jgi:hypothetical protein